MQFSWTTFFIEIINFIVLIWILKRLLYIPVKNAIEKRKTLIQGSLNQAEKLKKEAELLETKYKNRLSDWEQEKSRQKNQFHQEMVDLKTSELDKLHEVLESEKQKSAAIVEHQLKSQMESNLHESLLLAADFSTRLLKRLAGPQLEDKLIQAFIEDLANICASQVDNINAQLENDDNVQIQSAFPMSQEQQQLIIDHLQQKLRKPFNCTYLQQPELLAGLRVQIGSLNLQANLRDELNFFAEVARGSFQY